MVFEGKSNKFSHSFTSGINEPRTVILHRAKRGFGFVSDIFISILKFENHSLECRK